jgi:hypothetical protein
MSKISSSRFQDSFIGTLLSPGTAMPLVNSDAAGPSSTQDDPSAVTRKRNKPQCKAMNYISVPVWIILISINCSYLSLELYMIFVRAFAKKKHFLRIFPFSKLEEVHSWMWKSTKVVYLMGSCGVTSVFYSLDKYLFLSFLLMLKIIHLLSRSFQHAILYLQFPLWVQFPIYPHFIIYFSHNTNTMV